ncbi:hypothetical protein B0T24DRAFT_659294 [Lasiosphaeria ovina]|uniref:Kelch repeat protein n=1 Tax=Lasiosphaeria ovina TaxID=92902 RepID=A0AAE0N215_9PEZI|nr:hypothetical protein B0T24DRAFT_659294 [Lasiosphaeria ovina]
MLIAACLSALTVQCVSLCSYDISQHFCRVYRHASVFADGKIYIDGGNTYVPRANGSFSNTPAGAFIKGMNNNLVVLDLSKSFTNQDSFPYSSIHKGPDVPSSLIEHALWYSPVTRKIYQLGGWFSFNNVNDPGYKNLTQIPPAAVWEFDVDAQTWSEADDLALVDTGPKVQRPGAAANCDVPSLNRSFIFEGYVQQRSDQEYTSFTASSEFKFLEGMLSLDTGGDVAKPTLTNISVPQQMDGKDFGPRMNGAMVHLAVGKYGVLVQIGGQTASNPTPYGRAIENANAGNTNILLSYVDIYDIESGFWFRQQTFGLSDGIPSGRSDICAVAVAARDKSSFNVYMVAGVDTYASYITTEEIWVLTDGIYGHTCHAVGENLLVVGGMKTKPEGGDVATCSEHMPAEIYSLALQNYTGVFDADGAARTAPVPSKVVDAIGGTPDGGAYITSPKVWSDLYLQYVFNPTLQRPAYTPTYVLANATNDTSPTTSPSPNGSSESPGTSKSVVIGASVGATLGFLGLLATGTGLFLLFRRKRGGGSTDDEAKRHQRAISHHSELPGYSSSDVKYEAMGSTMQPLSVPQMNGPAELGADYQQQRHVMPSAIPSTARPHSIPSDLGLGGNGSGGSVSFAPTDFGSFNGGSGSSGREMSLGQPSPPLPTPTPGGHMGYPPPQFQRSVSPQSPSDGLLQRTYQTSVLGAAGLARIRGEGEVMFSSSENGSMRLRWLV